MECSSTSKFLTEDDCGRQMSSRLVLQKYGSIKFQREALGFTAWCTDAAHISCLRNFVRSPLVIYLWYRYTNENTKKAPICNEEIM